MKLFETILDLVTLPIEIVKDVFTMGNLGEGKTYTRKRIEELDDDINDD